MPLLEESRFLTELNKLYERHKTSGTVWVTMKRTDQRSGKKQKAPAGGEGEGDAGGAGAAAAAASEGDYKCLVRATDGKRKFSTALTGKQLSRFLASYSIMQKAHMDALKSRPKERGATAKRIKQRETRALG